MRRYAIGLLTAMAATGMAASPAQAADKCKVAAIANLPVTLLGRRALVDAKFGDHATRFIVDSGAFYSTISRASAAEFGLSLSSAPPGFRLRGINGDASVMVGRARDFSLAGIAIPKVDFIVGGSDTGTAGLLGQNILGLADVEYDLPHGMIRLMRVNGCRDMALAYWAGTKPFSMIPLDRTSDGIFKPHTIGTITVNGVKMRAIFDSGAETTVMTLAAAKRAGVTPDSPGVEEVNASTGLGSKRLRSWRMPFKTIDLGGEIVPNPKLRVTDMDINGDMLVGFDFFLTHRIFVSNANHVLYMTYEGGPVFGMNPTGARTSEGEKLDLTDATAAEPTDAAGFSRRGSVYMSKRDYAKGLADFDRAVALAPTEGRYVYLRGVARLANGQLLLAAADLDKAAALMPTDAETHLARASLRARNRDPEGAYADARIADANLDPRSDHRLQLAGLYNGIDHPEEAIANYDAWLKLHGQDADRATAYNGRCWGRGLLDRDLDGALSDCKAALKLQPNNPGYLDSRALIELRMGRFDDAIADYDAALKLRPRNAWSLYARSIAYARAGKKDAAAADRAAALAIAPQIGERFAKFGLTG